MNRLSPTGNAPGCFARVSAVLNTFKVAEEGQLSVLCWGLNCGLIVTIMFLLLQGKDSLPAQTPG